MRRLTLALLLTFCISGVVFAQADSGWVDNKEGCWCGYQTGLVRDYHSKGNHGSLADRQATADMLVEWNKYCNLFNVIVAGSTGLGSNNGINEVNTFINGTESQSVYGFDMNTNLFGRAVMWPDASFGQFNECKDFDSTGCGAFTETDVVINQGFSSGWTPDWFAPGAGQGASNPAIIQTTALHEVGHTLGFHHIFTLPVFGDSYSTMNYVNDDTGKFVTRMDAKTFRAEYTTRCGSFTDVAIHNFIFGNTSYATTYATVSPTTVPAGDSLTLNNWLIQNTGTATASNVVVTFYLFPTNAGRKYPEPGDISIGTANYASMNTDTEQDVSGTPLTVPGGTAEGAYYLGAIVTVNGSEDMTWVAGKPNNNRWALGFNGLTTVTVGSGGGGSVLSSGVPVNGSVAQGSADFYTIEVPSGATQLDFTLTNLTADGDLYVRYNQAPNGGYDYVSWNAGTSDEMITVTPSSTPQPLTAGTWHVAVDGYEACSYTLTATVSGGVVCTYSISPTTATAPAGGTSGSVSVTTTAGCAWTAVSNAGWITITGGSSGTGSGTASYSVTANTGAARSGTCTIAGQTFTVNQDGAASCTYSISPTSASAPAGGTSGHVSVTTTAGCAWTAVSNAGWITITGGSSGTGSGTTGYTVAANSGSSRSGTCTIAGQTFTVNQTGGTSPCNATRTLPGGYAPSSAVDVSIVADPPGTANVYAVEDTPPTGWTVSDINESGQWDSVNKKVKWGPYFDTTTRTLTYKATPPGGETGDKTFSGVLSIDGTNQDICGDTTISPGLTHPADTDTDYMMEINEVTAYGSAWKRGDTWPTPPNPIPIDYVTNAGALWKQGENYHYDAGASPPWVAGVSLVGRTASIPYLGTAVGSTTSGLYTPGNGITVTLDVSPDLSTLVYAVEDRIPGGWSVEAIGENGAYDPVNGRVKWGPFFDSTPRILSYTVIPPEGAPSIVIFEGTLSMDGQRTPITGTRSLQAAAGPMEIRRVNGGQQGVQ